MKRISMLSALVLVTALLLTACGDNARAETTLPTQPPVESTAPTTVPAQTEPPATQPTEQAHVHTPTQYQYDANDHWYICGCGWTEYEVHSLDSEGYCAGCGVIVVKHNGGFYDILTRDEHGTFTSETNYDEDGNVLDWVTTDAEYYPDGNLKHTFTRTRNGRNHEFHYVHRESGEGVRCDYRIYHEPDGWYNIHYLDEREDLIQINTYNPQDELVSVEDRIYEYAPDGGSVHLTCIVDGVISETRDYRITADGTWLMTYFAQYQDGKIDYVSITEYDENGNIIHQDIIFYDEDGNPIERPE